MSAAGDRVREALQGTHHRTRAVFDGSWPPEYQWQEQHVTKGCAKCDALADVARLEAVAAKLAAWDRRYGRDTVHSYTVKEQIHRELDEICDMARALDQDQPKEQL